MVREGIEIPAGECDLQMTGTTEGQEQQLVLVLKDRGYFHIRKSLKKPESVNKNNNRNPYLAQPVALFLVCWAPQPWRGRVPLIMPILPYVLIATKGMSHIVFFLAWAPEKSSGFLKIGELRCVT